MRKSENGPHDLEVIAGPCSLDVRHLSELYEMAEMHVSDGRGGTQRGLSAVRWVGAKSRTELTPTGEGMGMDFCALEQAILYGSSNEVLPSVLLAQQFVRETGMGVAAEIMLPGIQMPFYEGRVPKGQFFPWNPAVNQLGWSVRQMAAIASRNDWTVGLKNGKWLDKPLEHVVQPDNDTITSMEKAWLGLATYAAAAKCKVAFIHRGVDAPEKGDFRNALVHEVVRRLARKFPNAGRYFDPSHSLGEKLKDDIVRTTIEAMKMTIGNKFLYTGILIEAGTSETDTRQHISLIELQQLLNEISKFRRLGGPFLPTEPKVKHYE